jgi:hypothetical protein
MLNSPCCNAVPWKLVISDAYSNYSSSSFAYNVASPCAAFGASTQLDTSACGDCQALINNASTTTVFTTANTSSFTATITSASSNAVLNYVVPVAICTVSLSSR